jgi:hypothetical protein
MAPSAPRGFRGPGEKQVTEEAREFSGIIEGILRHNDNVIAVIISGLRVEVADSTEIDGPLFKGKQAKVRAVRKGDQLVAERIEVNREGSVARSKDAEASNPDTDDS